APVLHWHRSWSSTTSESQARPSYAAPERKQGYTGVASAALFLDPFLGARMFLTSQVRQAPTYPCRRGLPFARVVSTVRTCVLFFSGILLCAGVVRAQSQAPQPAPAPTSTPAAQSPADTNSPELNSRDERPTFKINVRLV